MTLDKVEYLKELMNKLLSLLDLDQKVEFFKNFNFETSTFIKKFTSSKFIHFNHI